MYPQITSIVFFLIVFCLTIIERKKTNNIFTPFSVAAWPLSVIILFNNYILIYLDFPFISVRSIYFLLVNVLIIWLIGLYFSNLNPEKIEYKVNSFFHPFKRYNTLILVISWISIIIIFLKIHDLISANNGIWFLGSREYEKQMGAGLASHMMQISRVCFILYLLINAKSKKNVIELVTLFMLILSAISNQVKYPLIWIVLIIFFSLYLYKPYKKQLGGLIKLSFSIILIFLALMSIVFLSWDLSNSNIPEYLAKQFANYLASGPIVLDQWLNFGNTKPDYTLLITFKNLANVIVGNDFRFNIIKATSLGFFHVIKDYPSNVGTSFGLYYIIGGMPFTIAVTSIFSMIKYFIYYRCLSRPGPIIIFMNLFLLTISALSFFSDYLAFLSFWELPTLFALFIFLFRFLDQRFQNSFAEKVY